MCAPHTVYVSVCMLNLHIEQELVCDLEHAET